MSEQETMEDDEINLWAVKLATLEMLVKVLFVDFFKRGPEPLATANDCAELIRRHFAQKPAGSQISETTLALEESLNVFFDEVMHQLRAK